MTTSEKELEILREKSTKELSDLFVKISIARLEGNSKKEQELTKELENILRVNYGIGDLLGRRRTLLEANSIQDKPKRFRFDQEVTPQSYSLEKALKLPFREAALSILDERLFNHYGQRFYNTTLQEVDKIYGEKGLPRRAFGLLETKKQLFEKIGNLLTDAIEDGLSSEKTIKQIEKELSPWSRSYSENVYRTQMAQAYSAGRWRQLDTPEVRNVIGAIEFHAVGDIDTRPDHKALDGFIAPVDDPIWKWITPPIHFQCRCSISFVSKRELQDKGLIDQNGKVKRNKSVLIPKENFGERPDKRVYDAFRNN